MTIKSKLSEIEKKYLNAAICPECKKRQSMTSGERQLRIDTIQKAIIKGMSEAEFVEHIEKLKSWRA